MSIREAAYRTQPRRMSFPDDQASHDLEQPLGGTDTHATYQVENSGLPIPVRVIPLAPSHAADAAQLHLAGQTNTFLAELGPEILTIVYEKLPRTDVGFGFAAVSPAHRDDSPVVVGFVSAATSVGRLFFETATTRAGRLIPALTARCMRRPSLIGRTLQTAIYPFTSADDNAYTSDAKSPAELLSIMVEPIWRGRGVGALLVQALIHECAARNISHLHVTVDAGNDGARRFYDRHGFQEQKSFRLYGRPMLLYGREV